jgi:hypothetical protein
MWFLKLKSQNYFGDTKMCRNTMVENHWSRERSDNFTSLSILFI